MLLYAASVGGGGDIVAHGVSFIGLTDQLFMLVSSLTKLLMKMSGNETGDLREIFQFDTEVFQRQHRYTTLHYTITSAVQSIKLPAN
jgi:hypothetical protein